MFRCHLDAIFNFKMIADKLTKHFFWLIISIYKISKITQKVLLELSLMTYREAFCVTLYISYNYANHQQEKVFVRLPAILLNLTMASRRHRNIVCSYPHYFILVSVH